MVQIRQIKETDKPQWLMLRQKLWPDTLVEKHLVEMEDYFHHPETMPVFVAVAAGERLVGLLEVEIHSEAEGCTTDKVGYLEGWYVECEWRLQGIGSALIQAAEDWARAQGCTEMASDTDSNYPISPVAHEKLGCQEVTRVIHYRKDL